MSNGKVVLITGSSTGFGRLIADTLARKGYVESHYPPQWRTRGGADSLILRDISGLNGWGRY